MDHKLVVSSLLLTVLVGCGPQPEQAVPATPPAPSDATTPTPPGVGTTSALSSKEPAPAATVPTEKATVKPKPASKAPDTRATPAPAAPSADFAAAQAKYKAMCAGCHGQTAEGVTPFPRLAGQTAEELAAKLAKYRAGEKIGPMSSTMAPFARMLTEAEAKAVCAYLASL